MSSSSAPALNWTKLPDFTLADAGFKTLTPEVSKGYDIAAVRLSEKRREAALGHANAILSSSNGNRVRFFASEFVVAIGLAGATAQARRIRDFYPHNITMPTYQVTGQTLDQEDYGLLCEFVHQSHQDALYNARPIQFDLLEGRSFGIPKGGNLESERPIMRGTHKPFSAAVFIEQMPREHKQFVYAPIFSFTMAVVQSYYGIFEGVTAEPDNQTTFFEYLKEQEAPFTQAPKETAKNSHPSEETKLAHSVPVEEPTGHVLP